MTRIRGLPPGVYWSAQAKKWTSHIFVAKKSQYIGVFNTYTEARKAWEIVYFEWYGKPPPPWDPEDVLKAGEQRESRPASTNVSLRLPYEVVSGLKTLAKEKGVPCSTYMRNVLARHVEAL